MSLKLCTVEKNFLVNYLALEYSKVRLSEKSENPPMINTRVVYFPVVFEFRVLVNSEINRNYEKINRLTGFISIGVFHGRFAVFKVY